MPHDATTKGAASEPHPRRRHQCLSKSKRTKKGATLNVKFTKNTKQNISTQGIQGRGDAPLAAPGAWSETGVLLPRLPRRKRYPEGKRKSWKITHFILFTRKA